MEPHENQHSLQDPFTGYFSSLLSQEYKVSRTDHVPHPGLVLEPWPRASMNINTHGFMSFSDATQRSRNELENEDELQPHFQHQWRSGTNLSSTLVSHTTTQPQLTASNRYDNHDYFNVVPSIHISTSDLCSSLVSSSLDLNLQVDADILATPTYNGVSSSNSLYHAIGGPQESPRNSSNSNITLNSENGGGRTKKPSNFSEAKYAHHSEPKKLRTMPRSSCPPLKVRKEKLGDRIAALQRLVAPYGKTDTASVLTEAIGYIQFLHDQIQTLSVPYMESSNSKSTRTMQSDLSGKIQPNRDLRSRGLSLVPISYASCFNTYN